MKILQVLSTILITWSGCWSTIQEYDKYLRRGSWIQGTEDLAGWGSRFTLQPPTNRRLAFGTTASAEPMHPFAGLAPRLAMPCNGNPFRPPVVRLGYQRAGCSLDEMTAEKWWRLAAQIVPSWLAIPNRNRNRQMS